jgi:Fungal specific transcription factor domain
LCPDADFSKELGGNFDKDSWYKERMNTNKLNTLGNNTSNVVNPHTPLTTSSLDESASQNDDELHSSDDEYATISVTDELRRLSVERGNTRFFGKSSGVVLIQTAMDMKKEFTATNRGEDSLEAPAPSGLLNARRPEFWHFEPVRSFQVGRNNIYSFLQWIIPKFEDPEPNYQFPPSDLLVLLVDLYFANMNSFLPLLHRLTFEKSLREGLHHRDDGFGAVVLLVSAVGCRFSDDPRVILEGTNSTHSAGWAWFHQVQMVRRSLFSPPSLYDLQVYCVSALSMHVL